MSRRYSKLIAIANHIVWTEQEGLLFPFYHEGAVYNDQTTGRFTVPGRDVYCTGIEFTVQEAGTDPNAVYTFTFKNGAGQTISILDGNGNPFLMQLTGTNDKLSVTFPLRIPLPAGSVWYVHVGVSGSGVPPQGLNITYKCHYANGPIFNAAASYTYV